MYGHMQQDILYRDEHLHAAYNRCSCVGGSGHAPNSFVKEHYYCESGTTIAPLFLGHYYTDDPLWDGSGCVNPTNNCCADAGFIDNFLLNKMMTLKSGYVLMNHLAVKQLQLISCKFLCNNCSHQLTHTTATYILLYNALFINSSYIATYLPYINFVLSSYYASYAMPQ